MTEDIISLIIWLVIAGIVIYLIFRRRKEKKKENFEDRDN